MNRLLKELGTLTASLSGGDRPLPDFEHLLRGAVRYQDGPLAAKAKILDTDRSYHLFRSKSAELTIWHYGSQIIQTVHKLGSNLIALQVFYLFSKFRWFRHFLFGRY
jgi:hypothetical protein